MINPLNLLLPRLCVGCDIELKEGAICTSCIKTLSARQAPTCPHCDLRVPRGALLQNCAKILSFKRIAVAVSYDHPMAKATIDSLKYRRVIDLAKPLGQLLADGISNQLGTLPKSTFLVPIPLHKKREKRRGFNQALKIASVAGEILDIPVKELLIRSRDTQSQVGLASHARKENLAGAFMALGNDSNATYILIDDVITTGSTMRECTRALNNVGAKTVWAASVAQSTH